MIPFEKYAKIRNNYCLCYFGPCDEYLIQLRLLVPIIEENFPNLQVYIGCKDVCSYLLEDSKKVLISKLKVERANFAYVKELRYDVADGHPIEHFLNESGIERYRITSEEPKLSTNKCVIVSKSCYPTKNLTEEEVFKLQLMVMKAGYEPEVNGNIDSAGWVIGIESVQLFLAGSRNIKTTLIPTGIGTNLFKKMFPFGEVMSI